MDKKYINLKPFVKWAGGKGQVLEHIRSKYPEELGKRIKKYAEPFVGGGAVLFDILSNYDLDEIYISDINLELINTYKVIRDDVYKLIKMLRVHQENYNSLSLDERKIYYYEKRDRFNNIDLNSENCYDVEKGALFIFLNKTCFNGLYRVNKSGFYNVPMGSYKNPKICDDENLINVSDALKNVNIICGDYRKCENFVDKNTLVYFDPPYRPLNITSNFTSYTKEEFDDISQIELAEFATRLNESGAKFILSNSDPKNIDEEDIFFDKLYRKYNIDRINAKRMINSNKDLRGSISELLIVNY